MEPVKILSDELRIIEVVLDCLDRLADAADSTGRIDKQDALDIVDFIRNFADRCHHGKEEDHLFAALTEKGFPSESGPVGVMLHEHELGRAFVKGMAENIEKAALGEKEAITAFTVGARDYIILLRNHIHKEDNILFPIASRILTPEDKEKILQKFETAEKEHMGEGTHGKYLKLAESLARKYGVKLESSLVHSCACGH